MNSKNIDVILTTFIIIIYAYEVPSQLMEAEDGWDYSLESLDPSTVLNAMITTEEVDEIDASPYIEGFRSLPKDRRGTNMFIGKEAIAAFINKSLSLGEDSSYMANKAEEVVFDIWKMAKREGFQLDEDNELLSEQLRRWQAASIEKNAGRVVDELKSGLESDHIALLDRRGQELGLGPEMVREAAKRRNKISYEEAAAQLDQL